MGQWEKQRSFNRFWIISFLQTQWRAIRFGRLQIFQSSRTPSWIFIISLLDWYLGSWNYFCFIFLLTFSIDQRKHQWRNPLRINWDFWIRWSLKNQFKIWLINSRRTSKSSFQETTLGLVFSWRKKPTSIFLGCFGSDL